MNNSTRKYRTFRRSATNWEQFAAARKYTVQRNLTLEEARRACTEYNDNRTPQQIRNGTKLEFEAQ